MRTQYKKLEEAGLVGSLAYILVVTFFDVRNIG